MDKEDEHFTTTIKQEEEKDRDEEDEYFMATIK
jgi:hypothetical protein